MLFFALVGCLIVALGLGIDCILRGDFATLPGVMVGSVVIYGLLQARLALFRWWRGI